MMDVAGVAVMYAVRPVQFLLTHALAVCLCAGSLAPPAVFAEAGSVDVRQAAPGNCCCGTADGRCCGKGCCAAPIPVPVRQPPLREPSSPRPDLLALTAAAWHGSAVIPSGIGVRSDSERAFLASAVPSLQQAAVRINI
jgi:hypothetical protein